MNYSIAGEVVEMFPGYVRGVVIIDGLTNGESMRPEIVALLREAEQSVRENAALEDVAAHPRIAAWRAAFQKFGARPSKFWCSIEALARRVRKGRELPYINDLAAIGNVFSLRHLSPVGGHDIGGIRNDLRLGLAAGGETFTPFGTTEIEHPEPGEVVYLDGETVLCRRWTWRQAEFTKLTPQTTWAAINVDGMPPVPADEVRRICEEMGEMVVRFCGGCYAVRCLAAASRTIDLAV